MRTGNKVYVINVYNKEGDCNSDFRTKKKAQLLQLQGVVTKTLDLGEVEYSFGNNVLIGVIGFDCFETEIEALNRVNSLNEYFNDNNILIKD